MAHIVSAIRSYLPELPQREEGQGLVEYALILALIAVVCIVALVFLGQQILNMLNTLGQAIAGAP